MAPSWFAGSARWDTSKCRCRTQGASSHAEHWLSSYPDGPQPVQVRPVPVLFYRLATTWSRAADGRGEGKQVRPHPHPLTRSRQLEALAVLLVVLPPDRRVVLRHGEDVRVLQACR